MLDGLARALAEPMPRRRVLRLLGGSLVAAAMPAAAPRPARAAVTCGSDERTCQKGADAGFEQYCCPAPSWRHFCGSTANGYRCEDHCAGPHAFPCTGLVPDRHSGRNGVCCDSRQHARCDQDVPPRLSGGGSRPACVPKVCGPDITEALEDVLARVEARFAGWGSVDRFKACAALVTLPAAAISWDINQLGPGGRELLARRYRPDCATCGFSVQVGPHCHYAGSVNYALFGVMMRLCHDHYADGGPGFADWFSQNAMLELISMYKRDSANFQESNNWAVARYRSGPVRPTPAADRRLCLPCTKPFTGRLTFKWLPLVRAG